MGSVQLELIEFWALSTNVFGAMNVSRAFLPYMRENKTGTIAFVGSCYGWRLAHYYLSSTQILIA